MILGDSQVGKTTLRFQVRFSTIWYNSDLRRILKYQSLCLYEILRRSVLGSQIVVRDMFPSIILIIMIDVPFSECTLLGLAMAE